MGVDRSAVASRPARRELPDQVVRTLQIVVSAIDVPDADEHACARDEGVDDGGRSGCVQQRVEFVHRVRQQRGLAHVTGRCDQPAEQPQELFARLDEPAQCRVGDLVGVNGRRGEEGAGDVDLAEDGAEVPRRHLHHGQGARDVCPQHALLGAGCRGRLKGETEREGPGDVAGQRAELDQDRVAWWARREHFDRRHEVEDALVEPGPQGEHPDLDECPFVLAARRGQVDR